MYYIKQIIQQIKTRSALTIILACTLLILILLVKNHKLSLINHNTEAGYDELLTVVVGVLATIIVTTFSAIIVSLQLASAQFSPRILRGFFSEDGVVQFFLMSYFLCISYCLTVKFIGLTHPTDTFPFLGIDVCYPTLGIVIGILLVLTVFPIFIYYIIKNINAAQIIRKISNRTVREMNLLFEQPWEIGCAESFNKAYPDDYGTYLKVVTHKYGFLDNLNPIVFNILKLLGHKIYIAQFVGNFITKGAPIAYVDYKGNNALRKKLISTLINQGIKITGFRSYTQDVNFGIRQLVDIAVKAISPAVNDPTTAINCINYLGMILKEYVRSKFPAKNTIAFRNTNTYLNEFNFDKMLDLAFDQIYFWGRKDYIIVRQIILTIIEIIKENKNPKNLTLLVQDVIDMGLFEKTQSDFKNDFYMNEYVHNIQYKVLYKFALTSTAHIKQMTEEINQTPHAGLYAKSLAMLATQEAYLQQWITKLGKA